MSAPESHPHPRPGDDLVARFEAARGVAADGDWAGAALLRFVLDDVREEVARTELEEALAVVGAPGRVPRSCSARPTTGRVNGRPR